MISAAKTLTFRIERTIAAAPDEVFDAWLDPMAEAKDTAALLRPPPDDLLEMVRIGSAVNKVAHDGPEVQEPFDPAAAEAAKAGTKSPARAPRTKDDAQGNLF